MLSFSPESDSNEQFLKITNDTKVTIESLAESEEEEDTGINEETKDSESLPAFASSSKSPFAGYSG